MLVTPLGWNGVFEVTRFGAAHLLDVATFLSSLPANASFRVTSVALVETDAPRDGLVRTTSVARVRPEHPRQPAASSTSVVDNATDAPALDSVRPLRWTR